MVRGIRGFAAAGLLVLAGCASIPGKTGPEQAANVDALVQKTMADLEKLSPGIGKDFAASAGYVVMSNKLTKIPVFGVGSGHGCAVETATGNKTYLRLARIDVGAGWGARGVRAALIFTDEKKFKEFIDGKWSAQIGAEAAAKVGETGAAGGGGAGKGAAGYTSHMITDAGVSATVSAALIRVKPVKLKK